MTRGAFAPSYIWLLIFLLGAGTFLIRLSFIQLFGQLDDIPEGAERALEFVPVGVLSAIVVPRLVFVDGNLALWFGNERLIAGCLAAVVAWRTGSMLATLGVGMGTLWMLSLVL